MLVEEELLDFLERQMPAGSANRARDKKLIAHYYGFGSSSWPTYEQLAEEFGLGSRERVRQIINTSFRDKADISALPNVQAAAAVLEEQDLTPANELATRLCARGLTDESPNVRGLLNLFQDLKVCPTLDLYDCRASRVTRSGCEGTSQLFFAKEHLLADLKRSIKIARTLPGQQGLTRIDDLRDALALKDPSMEARIIQMVKADPGVCVIEQSGVEWYLFEDRVSTLVTGLGKVFNRIKASARF